jgi:hypothetical protein
VALVLTVWYCGCNEVVVVFTASLVGGSGGMMVGGRGTMDNDAAAGGVDDSITPVVGRG